MERKEGNLNKVLPATVGRVFLATLLAVGGMVGVSRSVGGQENVCRGKVDWKRGVAVCVDEKGGIVVQSPHGDSVPRVLPNGVCETAQVWANLDDIVGWYDVRYPDVELSSMDLGTGRVINRNRIFEDSQKDPCKK